MDDDINFLDLSDPLDPESDPTARGIVQCLRMLVDEATTLQLGRTLAALQAAMTVCAEEGETGDMIAPPDEVTSPRGILLH